MLARRIIIASFTFLLFIFITVSLLHLINKPRFKIIQYELNNKIYNLYLADTPKKWQYGLMYKTYDELSKNKVDGMLFIFPDKQRRVFYNKNTYVNLKIFWINGDKIIAETFLPSIKIAKSVVYVYSPCEVDKVVELVHSEGVEFIK